jgi:hypothetical protein
MLKKNTYNLFATFYGDEKQLPDNLEYKVILPLLRSGIIETARRPKTDKLVYCLCPHLIIGLDNDHTLEINPQKNLYHEIEPTEIKKYKGNKVHQKDSLTLLKSIPALHDIITHWQKSETKVHYIYERFKMNHFMTARDTSLPNIYTSQDKIYSNKYIRIENGMLYLIPEIKDNIDGFNIAHCYINTIKKTNERQQHFTFIRNSKELVCWTFHSMLPIVVCRALILCDPLTLIDDRLYNNETMKIKNVAYDHVKELKRIFGEIAVEEKND